MNKFTQLFNLNDVGTDGGKKRVPNLKPRLVTPHRIAFIGEAPGEEEEKAGEPFIGSSGYELQKLMVSAGIHRAGCLMANVCQIRPPDNKGASEKKGFFFPWEGPEIQEGLKELRKDIVEYNPNLVVLLGSTALKLLGDHHRKIDDWRGSVVQCEDVTSPIYGRKCLPTLHPARILRQWHLRPLLRFDIQRAFEQGKFPDYRPPQRELRDHVNAQEAIMRMEQIKPGDVIAIDIEGGYEIGMTCISIATSPFDGFIVAFGLYTPEEEGCVLRVLGRLLADSRVGKILQAALFDTFILGARYGITVQGVVEDTLLKTGEIYPELPKDLGTQASIFTEEPFYKFERKVDDMWVHYRYCIKDSCVTYEISRAQDSSLTPAGRRHYYHNVALLPIFRYMQHRGMRWDHDAAAKKRAELILQKDEIQTRIDARAGRAINVNSPAKLALLLYEEMGFPPQHPLVEGTRRLDRTRYTTDKEALLTVAKTHKDPFIFDILRWRGLDKKNQYVDMSVDTDGRIRCRYNIVGGDTLRVSSSTSETGSGGNLQAFTKPLRHICIADEGYDYFQCDLSGADGWTVAAHCARLGDGVMLDDYYAGIKPAKVIVLIQRHGKEVNSWSRDKIIDESKGVNEEGADGMIYFACKRVQHGTNYELGKDRMSLQITQDSYKLTDSPLYIEPKTCEALQNLYLIRYHGIRRWKDWVRKELIEKGYLVCASGHRRRFFGRLTDHDTYRKALAEEPQHNTTFVTNMAAERLWSDRSNRRADASVIIEPLHQVHDALNGQWPQSVREESRVKVRGYFNNPLKIGGISITIPFSGSYGRSWGPEELVNKI